jgi:hypothetical protein
MINILSDNDKTQKKIMGIPILIESFIISQP